MTIDHRYWAEYLLDGVDRRSEVQSIEAQIGPFSLDDAYLIQDHVVSARIKRGEAIVGAKLGLTSIAKQQQMGVNEPCYGWLFDTAMLTTDNVEVHELIHPRVEPEFVFVMAEDVSGAEVTAADILDATSYVCGGIEVIDSRYQAFKFTLSDVIADNTSAARARIGDACPVLVDLHELPDVPVSFMIDGVEAACASGAALLGSPAECVAMLARHLYKRGSYIKAGWTILAGAPTDAKPLAVGTQAVAAYASQFSHVKVNGR